MSAERGARSGGGSAEDKSQTEAAIVPHGGDVYSVLCFDKIRPSAEKIKRKSRPVRALWHAMNSRTRVCGAQDYDFVLVAGIWRFRRLYAVVVVKQAIKNGSRHTTSDFDNGTGSGLQKVRYDSW